MICNILPLKNAAQLICDPDPQCEFSSKIFPPFPRSVQKHQRRERATQLGISKRSMHSSLATFVVSELKMFAYKTLCIQQHSNGWFFRFLELLKRSMFTVVYTIFVKVINYFNSAVNFALPCIIRNNYFRSFSFTMRPSVVPNFKSIGQRESTLRVLL